MKSLLLLVLGCTLCLRVANAEDLRLILPPTCYAVVGQPMSLYFDNVVLTPTPEAYRFEVRCAVGQTEARRWTVTASADQVGTHDVHLKVADRSGKPLTEGKLRVMVMPAAPLQKRETLKLLIVGDSLTHATHYPNELARLVNQPDHPQTTLLGTHRPPSAQPGVAHEGYGGWTWQAFLSRSEPKQPAAGEKKKGSSPFVFPDEAGKSSLNLKRYFDEKCQGQRPDVVTFLLGINDCFGAKPDDPAAMDKHIDGVLAQAETLLQAFRKELPEAQLAIGLTTPPNVRQEAFVANYQDKYSRWNWKRIQHRLVEKMLAKFSGRSAEHLHLVPTHLNLDPVDGYPNNNGVHPNEVGYRQIGMSFYAWIRGWMPKMAAKTSAPTCSGGCNRVASTFAKNQRPRPSCRTRCKNRNRCGH